jgi:hypothetical protein
MYVRCSPLKPETGHAHGGAVTDSVTDSISVCTVRFVQVESVVLCSYCTA